MRRKLLAGLLAILIGFVLLLATFRRNLARDAPLLDGSTITLVPGVHLIGGVGPAAAYAVETSEGLLLVDAGVDAAAASLKSEMAKLGLDWKNVRAVLLTHVHGDHCGGAEYLRKATGATIYAGRADAPFLRAGGPREAVFSTFLMPHHSSHSTTVDVELQGDETLAFGDVRVLVLGTPGHTPGSTCYLVERAGLRAFCAGDVILSLAGKRLGTYSAYLAPRYRGDAKSFLNSLTKLRTLTVPDLVLPGHPNSSPTPQSPHLAPQQWIAMLDDGIMEMQQLVDQYQSDGANFLDGQPKLLLPGLYYLGDFQGAAVYSIFAAPNLFVIDAPGGSGLADFIQSRLRQLGVEPVAPTAVLLTACGQRETAGLKELTGQCHAQVICSSLGVARIRKICGPDTIVVSADDLPDKGWLPVTTHMLAGRGPAAIAYSLKWADKIVLFAGTMPTNIDQNAPAELLAELAKSTENTLAYIESLQRLAQVAPDLWLPAVPHNGQNANLYGNSWADLLENNHRAAIHALRKP